jgi:hypothetical protein
VNKRTRKGKYDVIYGCYSCNFCISFGGNESLCSAEAYIATVDDFHKTIEERRTFYHNQLENKRYAYILKRICPNCESYLVERTGQFGGFLGCSRFPHCRFTVYKDKETGEIIMRS